MCCLYRVRVADMVGGKHGSELLGRCMYMDSVGRFFAAKKESYSRINTTKPDEYGKQSQSSLLH